MAQVKTPKPGQSKRRIYIINFILIMAVVAGLAWAAYVYLDLGKSEYTNDAQIEEFITPINTRVSGYITEIKFIEHQKVKKGDTLVILWDKELRIAEQQAEAAYLNALASRKVTSSSVNTVRNNVAISEANISALKARLWNAEQNYNRYAALVKDDVVTGQQFDQIKSEYQAMQAQYDALVSQRQSSELATVETGSRLGVNDAEIKRTKAVLDMARLNVYYTVITAPYDGVVGRRTIQEGQLLQAGQTIVSIVKGGQRWIAANYRETQLPGLAIGQRLMVKVNALNNKVYEGKVTAISQATGSKYSAVPVDNSTGNFVKVQQRIPVRVEFTEKNTPADLALLRAGMNVELQSNL